MSMKDWPKLFFKNPFSREAKMSKKYEYQVGDKVRVRDWEDMLLERGADGLDKGGTITLSDGLCFVSNMRPYCGKVGTITEIRGSGEDTRFRLDLGERTWWYSSLSVRLVESAPQKKPDEKTETACDKSERIAALEAEIKKLKEQVKGEDPMGVTADKTKAKVLKPIMPRVFRHACGAMSVFQKPEHIVPPFIEGWTEGKSVLNWHHWSGGKCPISAGTLTVAYLRNGSVKVREAENFRWTHEGQIEADRAFDIVAYAVIEPPKLEGT